MNDALEDAVFENNLSLTVYKGTKDEICLVAGLDTVESYSQEKLLEHFSDCVSERFGLSLQKHAQFKELTPTEAKELLKIYIILDKRRKRQINGESRYRKREQN